LLGDVQPANLTAGLAAVLIYAVGPIPMYLATAEPLDPGGHAAVSGVFVAFITAGIGTIVLSLAYRQPLAIGWSMPGLIYMAAAAPGHTLDEMVGACLLASVVVALLTFTGLAARLTAAVPLPVVMGMLAGSTLAYCLAPIDEFAAEPVLVGAPFAGFFVARKLGRTWLPPSAGALAAGIPALVMAGEGGGLAMGAGVPSLSVHGASLDPAATIPLALPLVIITLVGNAQGLAVLNSQGYQTPFRAITAMTALMSFVHALYAAPPASMQRAALATVAGPDAGAADRRYIAAIIAAIGAVALAFTATSAHTFTEAVPPEFIAAIVGVIMLGVALEAMKRAVDSTAPTAGFVAFLVAASSMNAGGVGPAFWAMVAGVGVYWWTERRPVAAAPAVLPTEAQHRRAA
jgi:benzoate membrane transport protein